MDEAGKSDADRDTIERRALETVEHLLDLNESERAAALTALDESDPPLAGSVRRLLARDIEVHDWMPTEAPGLWSAAEDRIPDRIGPFRIDGLLGRGGMGVVLKGVRDDGLFAQNVAIKLMRAGIVSFAQHERFILERQILARLDSPAVCRILDGGVWDDRPYLIMEHVDGVALTTWAEERNLDLSGRIALWLKVCEAVRYAHRQLIIHADLKPSNIMVTADGQVKLLDFGIARLVEDETVRDPASLSGKSGSITLTRAYAAPERRRGERPSIEGDVYSLGAILHELLTGRIGPHGDAAMPAGQDDRWPLASSVGDSPPVPANLLAGDLDAILSKTLSPDPADRYPDVAALVADIEAWRDGYPVAVNPPGLLGRTSRFIARHRRGVVIASCVSVLIMGAAGFAAIQAIRAERAREVAERRFGDVRALARQFDIYDELARHPGTVEKRAQIAATSAAYLARLQIAEDAPVDLRLETARSYRRLADIRGYPSTSNTGESAKARDAVDAAQRLLDPLIAANAGNKAARTERGWLTLTRLALSPDTPAQAKLIEAARDDLSQEAASKRARLGLMKLSYFEAYKHIWADDTPSKAIPVARSAIDAIRAEQWPPALANDALSVETGLLNVLGDATYYAGDQRGALKHYREADAKIDAAIARQGPTPSLQIAKAFAAWNLSGTLGELSGHDAEALAIAGAGVASMEQLIEAGPDSAAEKILLILYGQQATVLENMKRTDQAVIVARRSVALRERRLATAPKDPQLIRDLAIGLIQQGRLLGRDSQPGAACKVATRSIALWESLKARRELSKFDENNELPKSEELVAKNCS